MWRNRAEHPYSMAILIGMGALIVALGMMALAILLLRGVMVGK
jgi:hypothetical protein